MHEEEFGSGPFPKGTLIAAAALLSLALAGAVFSRTSGIGTLQMPAAQAVEIRDLRFEDRKDGAVAVREASSGDVVAVVPPGSNGFLRGVLRGLARERKRQDIGMAPAFRLTRWSDGRLSLDDTATHRHVELESFGETNVQAFSRLLAMRDNTR